MTLPARVSGDGCFLNQDSLEIYNCFKPNPHGVKLPNTTTVVIVCSISFTDIMCPMSAIYQRCGFYPMSYDQILSLGRAIFLH